MLLFTVRRRVRVTSFILVAVLAIVCTEAALAAPGIKKRVAALEILVEQQANLITALQNELASTEETIPKQ